jgi:protein-disulfide isomerase-like protein with CxxC motif
MSPSRVLWYFADPMCSWCWGFSPVIGAIKETYSERIMKHKTRTHFQVTREAGVRGFPTIVLQNETSGTLLNHGYRRFDELKPEIENWLAGPP